MSIDARVETVIIHENGGGELRLIDRPPTKPGQNPGIAGQKVLAFDGAPEEITALNGLDIWGGDSSIMLGDVKIARRTSWTKIEFLDRDTFLRGVRDFHDRRNN